MSELYDNEISFDKILESLEIPKWFKKMLLEIWDLNQVNDSWTVAKVEDIIENSVEKNEAEIREYLKELLPQED